MTTILPTLTIALPLDFAVTAHDHTLTADDLAKMAPKAVAYLVANGYRQSLANAATVAKKEKEGKSSEQLKSMAAERRARRHEAILAGTVGQAVATLTPIESYVRDVVDERIRAIAASRGVAMPKGDVLIAARSRILESYRDDVEAEAQARLASARGAAASAADGILGTP